PPRRGARDVIARAAAASRFAVFVHRSRVASYLLLVPSAFWILVFFLVPLGIMTWRSVSHDGFSLAIYGDLVTSPQYIKVMLTSLKIVTYTTVANLVLGYSVSY